MKFWFWLALALLPLISWAGPPFETDDPEPTDYRHWEIYLGTTGVRTQPGYFGTAPFLNLNYGGLPDLQLSLTSQFSLTLPDEGASHFGFGDTLVGGKWRFIHETDNSPQVAVFPQVSLPTGDTSQGLGYGQYLFLLPLWAQKSWGPWTTFGGAGYWFNPGPGEKNWVFAGWELQRDLSETFTVGGEVFYHSADQVGIPDGAGFNLGGFINLDPLNHIVFSFGRDFIQNEYPFTGYAAWEWTFSMDPSPEKNEKAK